MTVREMIEILNRHDPEAVVKVLNENAEIIAEVDYISVKDDDNGYDTFVAIVC